MVVHAEHHLGALTGRRVAKRSYCVRGDLTVCRKERDPCPLGRAHAGLEGSANAAVRFVAQQLMWRPGQCSCGLAGCSVRGSIVDEDDFSRRLVGAEPLSKLGQHRCDVGLFVERKDDDAQVGTGHSGRCLVTLAGTPTATE